MWPFTPYRAPEDDRRRLNGVIEAVESLRRRFEGMVADLDEFYGKVNRARQRVDKADRDARDRAEALSALPHLQHLPSIASSRADQKSRIRSQFLKRGA